MSTDTPRVPTGTYRLQLHEGFTFHDAAEVVDYLAGLGVSHVYCSPVLQAVPGSSHGYDVVDHSRLSDDLGGTAGFDALVSAARRAGLGLVVDVVPNHMAVPVPESLNAAWWSLLAEGGGSPYAGWFDVDWSAHGGRVLMPVLGASLGDVLESGELVADTTGSEPVLRYHDHVLPLAQGTERLPLPDLVDAQHYRLAYWRVGEEELNYRRFFDITTLAGLRVENPEVFAATHEVLLDRVRAGQVDGLRIDHPDGLADPRGYLRALASAAPETWVVAEKILEGGETLPPDWPCAGTTGYEALRSFGGVLVDPDGEKPLTDLYTSLTGEPEFSDVVEAAKRHVVRDVLGAEVGRLTGLLVRVCAADLRLRDHTRRGLQEALEEVLVAFDVYRAYVVPGEQPGEHASARVEHAADVAARRLPRRAAEIGVVRDLALGRYGWGGDHDEIAVRFAQTCGPVMAKGVEDTAFYRDARFVALNEVGGDPSAFGVSVTDLHEANGLRQRQWPDAMTTLSTHDTKRGEDVRARLAVLSEVPREWSAALTQCRAHAAHVRTADRARLDPATEYLFWQTLVGVWPAGVERLLSYMEKATREAKRHTSWTRPDPAYDEAVRHFVTAVTDDEAVRQAVQSFVGRILPYAAQNVLAQKLLQLASPGVPDVYQGTECEALTLVDPDNRRPVDFGQRQELLAHADLVPRHAVPDPATHLDAAKLLVTSRALRLRREHPDWFGRDSDYRPLHAEGAAAGHLVGFSRAGEVVAAVPRLTVGLERRGGWSTTALPLPPGQWTDVFTGAGWTGGPVPVADLLGGFPVALLVRD